MLNNIVATYVQRLCLSTNIFIIPKVIKYMYSMDFSLLVTSKILPSIYKSGTHKFFSHLSFIHITLDFFNIINIMFFGTTFNKWL